MTDYFIWYLENKNFKKDSQLGIIVPPPHTLLFWHFAMSKSIYRFLGNRQPFEIQIYQSWKNC